MVCDFCFFFFPFLSEKLRIFIHGLPQCLQHFKEKEGEGREGGKIKGETTPDGKIFHRDIKKSEAGAIILLLFLLLSSPSIEEAEVKLPFHYVSFTYLLLLQDLLEPVGEPVAASGLLVLLLRRRRVRPVVLVLVRVLLRRRLRLLRRGRAAGRGLQTGQLTAGAGAEGGLHASAVDRLWYWRPGARRRKKECGCEGAGFGTGLRGGVGVWVAT